MHIIDKNEEKHTVVSSFLQLHLSSNKDLLVSAHAVVSKLFSSYIVTVYVRGVLFHNMHDGLSLHEVATKRLGAAPTCFSSSKCM